jgi:3-deoxy-D-manno-octulosonate 8-phosphate phosphatase (KDO 8-P phosphatase)
VKLKIHNRIKVFAMDVDGVLTDGGMYYSRDGEIMKKFSTRDGKGIELLHKNGIIPVIITQEDSEIVKTRAAKLKVKDVYCGVPDKLKILDTLKLNYGVSYEEIAYIGDDLNDLGALKQAGLSFAPCDAINEVKNTVDYVVKQKGGEGAVREAIELVLEHNALVQGKDRS